MDIPEHIRSALHNYDRTQERREWRWQRHARTRLLDVPEEDPPPGARGRPRHDARAPEGDVPWRQAAVEEFKEQNRELLEQWRRTPTCEKRERSALKKQLTERLVKAGLMPEERYHELCGEPRSEGAEPSRARCRFHQAGPRRATTMTDHQDKKKDELVRITIAEQAFEVSSGVHPVAELKELADLGPDDNLERLEDDRIKPLNDEGKVNIKGGEEFVVCGTGAAS